jgi:hypothetical protein
LAPEYANRIPTKWDTRVADLRADGFFARSIRAAAHFAQAWLALLVTSLVAYWGWIASARNRQISIGLAGASLGAVGMCVVAARRIIGTLLSEHFDDPGTRDAVRAVYDVTTAGLHRIGIACVSSGLVIVAASTIGSALIEAASRFASVVARLTRVPSRAAGRLIWGVLAVGGGLAPANVGANRSSASWFLRSRTQSALDISRHQDELAWANE